MVLVYFMPCYKNYLLLRGSSIKNIPQIRTNTTDRKKKSVRSHFGPKTGKTGFTMKLKKKIRSIWKPKIVRMSSVEFVLGRKILFQFKRKEFYIPSEKVAWRAGSFGTCAHMYFQLKHVRELPKHVATNGHRIPDVIASQANNWEQENFNAFPTQPAPSTRQITQRLLYF